ncbi:DUF58 domain-containing protein [Marisediminicola senii]|uniref:DUF58 domain-containing protein n=1 Tax=Marisediminicola senii TaxID=2711233 RepID=UPI0013EDB9AB|nr:DUF58 domain-containing protein [Marisediminicola senii]
MPRLPLRADDGRVTRLSRRGWGLLTVGAVLMVVAYVGDMAEFAYGGALALLLPGIAYVIARFRRVSLEVTRTFSPAVVSLGDATTVDLQIRNRGVVPTPHLICRDVRPWSSGPDGFAQVPPISSSRGRALGRASTVGTGGFRYELLPPHRGVFSIGPMEVVLADPFGFASTEISIGQADRLIVTPRLVDMPDTGLAVLASEGSSMLVRRSVGGDDDLSTREYRRGDALRRVHWRATARHGDLMVRQEEPRSHAEARVILDTRLVGYTDSLVFRSEDDAESAAFELAISLAASIALHLARGGFEVEIVETGPTQLDSVAAIDEFLETLAEIALTETTGGYSTDPSLDPFFRAEPGSGSVFAILSEADAATVDRLVGEPSSFELAIAFVIGAAPGSSVVDRLRAAGWTCVPMGLDDTVDGVWRAVSEMRGARDGR